MERDINKYINEVKSIIPINSKDRSVFLALLKQNIKASFQQNDSYDYDTIIKMFGRPTEVAASYIEELDTNTVIKALKKRHYIKILFTSVLISILIITGFEIYRLNQLYNEVRTNQPSQVETIIE